MKIQILIKFANFFLTFIKNLNKIAESLISMFQTVFSAFLPFYSLIKGVDLDNNKVVKIKSGNINKKVNYLSKTIKIKN